ncbi:prefoldin subunit alpha [Candidatus Pacearchaeota archaeon CG10_big_fil_rev_8_21_14_0_10_31_24]|nr:MAG: prefoldin subunit alpha [Candidatus Pacearchaeota archaeon CG10_big_fil_rev_8_21_14_0_10_31_24]
MSHELIHQAQELERYTAELEEHIKFLENQIQELEQFAERLTLLNKSTEKNILSSIGKGVYLPAELKDTNLLVEVGTGVIVKKSPMELKDVVIEQISKLQESKISLISQIGFYTQKIQEIMLEVQNSKGIS